MSEPTPTNPNPEQGPLPYGGQASYPQQPGAASVPPPGATPEAQSGGAQGSPYAAQNPQQGSPYATQDPQFAGAAAGGPGSAPRRSRKGKIIGWSAAGVAIAVGGSVGGFAMVAQATQTGADSPQAAIERLDSAIAKKDKVELAKLMSAAEMKPFFENIKAFGIDSGLDKLQSKSGVPYGEVDQESVQKVLDAITVSRSDMEFTVSEKSNTIALAELQSWNLDVKVDRTKLIDALVFAQQRAGQSNVDETRKQLESTISEKDLSYNGNLVGEGTGKLSIALVKEEDRWYVSPIMTAANAAFVASKSDAQPKWDANVAGAVGKGSPSEAVSSTIDKIMNTKRPADILNDEFASALALPERRALMVFGPAMLGEGEAAGDSMSQEPTSDPKVQVNWGLSEHRINDDLTVVGPGATSISEPGSENRITFDGAKVSMGEQSYDLGEGLANPQRLGLATVRENGTWRVSLLDTIGNISTFAGNDKSAEKLKEMLQSGGESMGLKWDELDERTRVNMSGVFFFLVPAEQISKDMNGGGSSPYGSEESLGTDDGLGTDDPYGDTGLGDDTLGDDGTTGEQPNAGGELGTGTEEDSGLGTSLDPRSIEANLGKLFGNN